MAEHGRSPGSRIRLISRTVPKNYRALRRFVDVAVLAEDRRLRFALRAGRRRVELPDQIMECAGTGGGRTGQLFYFVRISIRDDHGGITGEFVHQQGRCGAAGRGRYDRSAIVVPIA
jgi:hypothetical protein